MDRGIDLIKMKGPIKEVRVITTLIYHNQFTQN
jgi:hypothetical protein